MHMHRSLPMLGLSFLLEDPNPFVSKHRKDAAVAWRLDAQGLSADVGGAQGGAQRWWRLWGNMV